MFADVDFSTLDLMDALDLAILIEVEATGRYQHFVELFGIGHPDDAASVFYAMAENEKKHGDELTKRRKALFGDTAMRVSMTDLYDVEAPEEGAPRWDMSKMDALLLALSSEKKAYVFYDEALPYVRNAEVKALFEELREEEQEHVDMLKAIIDGQGASAGWRVENLDA